MGIKTPPSAARVAGLVSSLTGRSGRSLLAARGLAAVLAQARPRGVVIDLGTTPHHRDDISSQDEAIAGHKVLQGRA